MYSGNTCYVRRKKKGSMYTRNRCNIRRQTWIWINVYFLDRPLSSWSHLRASGIIFELLETYPRHVFQQNLHPPIAGRNDHLVWYRGGANRTPPMPGICRRVPGNSLLRPPLRMAICRTEVSCCLANRLCAPPCGRPFAGHLPGNVWYLGGANHTPLMPGGTILALPGVARTTTGIPARRLL